MTKKEFMELCESRWEKVDKVSSHDNLYDLEKEFTEGRHRRSRVP